MCLSIHQLTDSWVASTFLVLMDSPTVNVHVPVFVQTYALIGYILGYILLGYILRDGTTGS